MKRFRQAKRDRESEKRNCSDYKSALVNEHNSYQGLTTKIPTIKASKQKNVEEIANNAAQLVTIHLVISAELLLIVILFH